MKKIISKIALVFFTLMVALGFSLPGGLAFATAIFNTNSQDLPTLQVSNYSRNPGCSNCWSNSVSANSGDVVSFLVYYHNSSNETANQTHVSVNLPSGSAGTANVTSQIVSSNAISANGNATINLSSAQNLTFIPGTVSWYPNRSSAAQALLSGQNGNEITTGAGLDIGDIVPGWGSQGYIVFRAQVGNSGGTYYGGGSASAPSITTTLAGNIANNSATINASLNPNGASTNVWFEWGTSQSLGNTTSYQAFSTGYGNVNVSGYLSNLNPGTTYYFRAVAQNSYGTNYGSIISFTTTGSGYNYSGYNYNYGYNYNNNYCASGYNSSACNYNYSNTYYSGGGPSITTGYANPASNSATLNATLSTNNNQTNVWFEYGPSQVLGYTTSYQTFTAGTNSVNVSGYLYNISPGTTYYYRAVAQNGYGTNYGTIMSFTTTGSANYYGTSGNGPLVSTNNATAIFRNSALLNGSVNPNNSLTTSWFEWGTGQSLGNKTSVQAVGSANYSSPMSVVLSGLSPNTTYYYRTAAQNSYGTVYGDTMSFTTRDYAYVPAVQEKTIIVRKVITTEKEQKYTGSEQIGVILTPSVDKQTPNAGDEITYTLLYQNQTDTKLNNAIVKVVLPTEVKYISSIPSPAIITGNELSFNLGNVDVQGQGVISIRVKISDEITQNSALMFGSTLNYFDRNNKFQSVSAYLTLIIAKGGAILGASLLDIFGSVFGNWFVELLIGLIIGFLVYHFFVKRKQNIIA